MTERHSSDKGRARVLAARGSVERRTSGNGVTDARSANTVDAWRSLRNGMPALAPYEWRPGDAGRDAEVATQLAAIRARLSAPELQQPEPDGWCEECGYRLGSLGHERECLPQITAQ